MTIAAGTARTEVRCPDRRQNGAASRGIMRGLLVLDSKKRESISQAFYEQAKNRVPVELTELLTWEGQRWEFGVADEDGFLILFKRESMRCFAIKTPILIEPKKSRQT